MAQEAAPDSVVATLLAVSAVAVLVAVAREPLPIRTVVMLTAAGVVAATATVVGAAATVTGATPLGAMDIVLTAGESASATAATGLTITAVPGLMVTARTVIPSTAHLPTLIPILA